MSGPPRPQGARQDLRRRPGRRPGRLLGDLRHPDDIAPGPGAVNEATRRAEQFASTWRASYPRAVECLLDGFELATSHLHHPRAHWARIRHTNLIERAFGETRRRVKVIGPLPGERSALSLLWAVLDRAAAGWRGFTYTPADVRHLQTIRRDLGLTRRKQNQPEPPPSGDVTAAA